MAKIVKTETTTTKVWTAQDFQERNKRIDLKRKAEAETILQADVLPNFIGELNRLYESDSSIFKRITIMEKRVRYGNYVYDDNIMREYVVSAIKKWAKPLGYGVAWDDLGIYLIIPDEPKTEKYEDS